MTKTQIKGGSCLKKGSINQKTAHDVVEKKVKPAHFYTLRKIHKRLDNPPSRPIVGSNRWPTERISAHVDLHLKPLVSSLPSYIRDTKDLLSQLQAFPPLPLGALLFTMDITALYTNIPHEAVLAACARVPDSRPNQVPLTDDIILLARLVLELNAFTYENQHYLQVCGTAMGTRMAPSYANIFMGVLEKNMLATAPQGKTPLFYKRFMTMCLAFGFSERRPCWLFSRMQTRLIWVSTSHTVLVQKWTSWIHLCRLEVTLFLRAYTRSPPILTSICCLPVTTLHMSTNICCTD